jgi:hypothetical protein
MTPAIVTSESHRNADDLRTLCDELQEDIAIRTHMIASDVAESLDKVNRWFQRKSTQDPTGNWKLIVHNIQLAKEKAMVSLCVYVSLQLYRSVVLGPREPDRRATRHCIKEHTKIE